KGQQADNLRDADPYGLAYFANAWHLLAYCHLRKGMRNFRLERMENLELLGQTFQRPADFQMGKPPEERRDFIVRALFDKEIARWVHEARHYSTLSAEETADGLLLTLAPRHEHEVRQWFLSWGSHVRVLEPESLRNYLHDEAEATLRNHQDQKSFRY
ncbi:MAG TPA: WYL domain-containing protein, partial [Ktedonobacteraceae bacterium]|nr:WYL domain-containing protein [Ktedonobacteraceae bacterium]